MTLSLLIFVVALFSLINTGHCFEEKKYVNLNDDVYEGITDRELMLALIRRIDDFEKLTQTQQQVNEVLQATNQKQQQEIDYMQVTIQKQQKQIDYLQATCRKQQLEFEYLQDTNQKQEVVERNLKRRYKPTKPTENPDSQGKASSERIIRDNQVHRSSTSGQLAKKQKQEKNIQRRQTDEHMRVAFYAKLSDHISGLGTNQVVEFENVTTNIGNAYNVHTGAFTAPYDGTYVFSTTLMALTRIDTHFIFVKNGARIARMYTRGTESPYLTTSHTFVLHMRRNDDVEVRNVVDGHDLHGDEFSSFSGFLLYPDDDPGVILDSFMCGGFPADLRCVGGSIHTGVWGLPPPVIAGRRYNDIICVAEM